MDDPSTARPLPPRTRSILRVLVIVLALNLAVALSKLIYGLISQSVSMQADGIHSLFDGISNLVGIAGIIIASRPADAGHPYGHAKFETYASLFIGAMLLIAAFEIVVSAINSLITQDYRIEVTAWSFAIMLGTLGVNLLTTFYERRQGAKLRSEILGADASHTLSDALVSTGVIIGLILASFGIKAADSIMALIVAVAIVWTAIDVFRHGFATLSDSARLSDEEVRGAISGIEGIDDIHRIRTRGTEAEIYVDLHISVDPDMTVRQAHNLANAVEMAIENSFEQVYEVLVHIEPFPTKHIHNRQPGD